MDALDLSNRTTHFSAGHVREWKDQSIGLAIIQLIAGVHLAGDDCATQIRTCLEGGLAVDCYVFPRNDGLPMSPADKLALVPADLKPKIRQLWGDVERAFDRWPTRAQADEVLKECDAWAPWQRTGTYSALWVADGLGWHPWPWPDRKQWLVHVLNSGAPNLGGTFDGTDNHVMTQYRMDVTENGVSGMDRSRLTDAEAQAVFDWVNGGNVVTDPEREQMQAQINGLITTVADIADRLGDQVLAETNRKAGMRKTELRRVIKEMQSERVVAVGPRP